MSCLALNKFRYQRVYAQCRHPEPWLVNHFVVPRTTKVDVKGTIQMLSPSLRIICGDWARKLFLNIILFYLFFSTVFAGDFEIVQSSAAPVSVCPYGPSCRTGLLLCFTLPRGCSSMRTSFLQISSYFFFPFIFFFLPANFSKKPDP